MTSVYFCTFLTPLLFVSNFILYNLEILLSNVSISQTPLPPQGADVVFESSPIENQFLTCHLFFTCTLKFKRPWNSFLDIFWNVFFLYLFKEREEETSNTEKKKRSLTDPDPIEVAKHVSKSSQFFLKKC